MSAAITNMGYQPIIDILQEIKKAFAADALMASLAMIFVGIDAMAWLSLPKDRNSVKGDDFCNWVDTYFKSDPEESYQYAGIDLYAARCAMLHTYGSLSNLHVRSSPPKTFGYLDNGSHQTDGSQNVLISIGLLIEDFRMALEIFLSAVLKDADLKARIDKRIPALVTMWPVRH